MITSFADKGTEDLYHGRVTRDVNAFPPDILKTAWRKLDMLNAAVNLEDLRVPRGNHLEALHGKLAGQHSIRVNDQWRIVFRWEDRNAVQVQLTDYH